MKTKGITTAGIIAAIYVSLTILGAPFASGVVQIRLAEALCILPVFTPYAVWGLFIGCFAANLITGAVFWDVIFGSLATLIGAVGTYLLKKTRIAILPPIIVNMVIVPFILSYAYGVPGAIWWFMITVGAGEVISCGILGTILGCVVKKNKKFKNI